MKKILKPMLLVLSAVLLVVASVLGTMAYMTSSSAVSNVFTVGNVTLNMTETKVESDGKPVTDTTNRTDTNSYHLTPGSSYLKDPTIYVDGNSDASYLFVRVRNDLKHIECDGTTVAADGTEVACNHAPDEHGNIAGYTDSNDEEHTYTHKTIVEQLKENGWQEIHRDPNNVDAVFVYVGAGNVVEQKQNLTAMTVGKGNLDTTIEVFHNFTLAEKVENLQIYGGARVAIVAYAIQANLPGFTTPDDGYGKYEAVTAAWDYIKNELPFVV